ncbi:MAG TPA: ribonuclease HII [Thermomicrobiales bacterium]|nr:ribonuclease HII [Thermomicrobiales bacterium]
MSTPERDLPERPTLDHEVAFWRSGFSGVAGVDEVGRGALAGPLVAAAVILPPGDDATAATLAGTLHRVRDSKQLDPATRSELAVVIAGCAAAWALGVVEAEELDRVGVASANRIAMERAVGGLDRQADALLIDARVIETPLPQVGLIKGDRHSLSIAAAAILAKVHRDGVMTDHHAVHAVYDFDRHKGYGTPSHLATLREHGLCPLHRRSFRMPGNEVVALLDQDDDAP